MLCVSILHKTDDCEGDYLTYSKVLYLGAYMVPLCAILRFIQTSKIHYIRIFLLPQTEMSKIDPVTNRYVRAHF